MPRVICPACTGDFFTEAADFRTIRREIRLRREFVYSRLRRRAEQAELKDLLDFMHGAPAPLLECVRCGLLVRAEHRIRGAGDYTEDPNDPDLMAQVYPHYLDAFRSKAPAYAGRLRPNADVLEIGSHLGAFLQTAEEWRWRPLGLDVGRDTSEFARRRGLTVHGQTIEDARLGEASFDAVFVWNCFEQLPDPAAALRSIRRVLKPWGLLAVRVPNALPYRLFRQDALEHAGFERKALAYNNLLGFPYLYGYTVDNLNRLLERSGFEFVAGFNSELVTTPFAEAPRALRREQIGISRRTAEWSVETTRRTNLLTGPWLEALYRKLPDSIANNPRKNPPRIELLFLPRGAAA
jgi:SAM-dependent methyltransferase